MKKLLLVLPLCAAGALMAAPAAYASDKTAADPRIGEEVNKICFSSSIRGWSAVKGEDGVILLERAVNDWYRVEVNATCTAGRIQRADSIGLDSFTGSGCLERADTIILNDLVDPNRRCVIKRINKWNKDAAAPETADEDA